MVEREPLMRDIGVGLTVATIVGQGIGMLLHSKTPSPRIVKVL